MKKIATRVFFAIMLAVYVASHFLPRAHAEAIAPIATEQQQAT